MRILFRLPVMIAVGLCLSGCTVYHVTATAVDATTTVVSTSVDVVGAVVSIPFGHSADKPDKD